MSTNKSVREGKEQKQNKTKCFNSTLETIAISYFENNVLIEEDFLREC